MNSKLVATLVVLAVLVVGIGGGATLALVTDDDGASPDGSAGRTRTTTADPTTDPTPGDPSSSDAPRDDVPAGLEEFYGQDLQWEDCGGLGLQCSRLTVPVDYQQPDGDTIELNLKRVPAADQDARVGSLVVNPGGPGAPGTVMADYAYGYFRSQLLERVDVVAFDPRGTGDSDPVDCLSDADLDAYVAQDPSPDDAAEAEEFDRLTEQFFAGCVANSDDVVGHVSTVEAARDMDVLRSALDEPKLSYLGFSYGTTLGSTYASLFPQNVGRFVLDGATDPTLDFRERNLSQAAGFETAIRAYVDDCVAGGGCYLGDSRDAALTTITDFLDSVEEQPLPTDSGRDLEIGNAVYGLIAPLYSRESWSQLDAALQAALDGDGTGLMEYSDLYTSRNDDGTYADNSVEAIGAINCLDDPSSVAPADIPAEYPAFEEASPTFGRTFAWFLAGCRGIQVEAEEERPVVRAEGADPIVVIGTTRDPATPYEEAVALADQLESGVLLSRDGDGHTAYNKGNDCIDEAVEGYLLDGVVPADGTEC